MTIEVDRLLEAMQKETEIHCPYCDWEYVDDDRMHVSYWGEDSQTEVTCGGCEEKFWLEERVRRTYVTAKTRMELRDA